MAKRASRNESDGNGSNTSNLPAAAINETASPNESDAAAKRDTRQDDVLAVVAAIDDWYVWATNAIEDIRGWRGAVEKRAKHYAWPDLSVAASFAPISYIRGSLVTLCPTVNTQSVRDLYGAIVTWYSERSAANLPPQDVLDATLELALADMQTASTALQDSVRQQNATTANGDGDGTPSGDDLTDAAPQWDAATEARNKWIHVQCVDGTVYSTIVARLRNEAMANGWQPITTVGGITRAAGEYAKRKNLPDLPRRSRGRPRR